MLVKVSRISVLLSYMNEGNSARESEINCPGDKKSPSFSELLAIAHVLSKLVILGPIRTSCRY